MRNGPRGGHGRCGRAVLAAAAALVFASLTARGALAQAAAPQLYVVGLATVKNVADRPATPIPAALRGNTLYWRVLRSGSAASYQLCMGFFGTLRDAEGARQQLAASFREARVIQVNPQERDNLEKASRAKSAAPAAAIRPGTPAYSPAPAGASEPAED